MDIQALKLNLSRVFDDKLKTKQWHNIGDPGGFADTPPITFVGRIIACVIGVLGIAIFAVPPEMLKRIKGHDFGMKDYVD